MLAATRAADAASEFDLIRQARNGSQGAFRELVARHQDRIFRLAHRFTKDVQEAEDIAQETFFKAFRRLHTFRFSSSFYTWLYRIGLNTANDCLEKRARRPVSLSEDPEVHARPSGAGGEEGPVRAALRLELREVTRRVLESLPEKHRSILVLREYEGLGYDEIAAVLDCPLGTVESRLFRARGRFRVALVALYPGYLAGTEEGGRLESWNR
ncbi:MAG TPA: sigma-70 family RNA polymerase sigma factor [Planctomycetota bacterium]|jgi:RNA polymerase sigma-70 factor (ECF subfamily)|nr:sigma-70 family RNA polymerase sigma factor [Planctomycetota bacterium]